MSRTSVDLPEPDTPVTATKLPSGISTSMFVRLCSRAPWMTSCSPVPGGGARRHRDRLAPGEVLAGDRLLDLVDALHGAAVDDGAAVLAGARADVDDPVALADRLLVVLDDDHGVAEVAQPGERVDEPPVVALVQADRRLVEHVQRADRPDPIWLARRMRCASPPAERAGRPRQREVVEADVEQEPEAGVDLLGHPLGDHPLALGQLEARRGTSPTRRSTARRPRRCCGR